MGWSKGYWGGLMLTPPPWGRAVQDKDVAPDGTSEGKGQERGGLRARYTPAD